MLALIFRIALVLPTAAGSLQLSNTTRAGLRNSVVTSDTVLDAADSVQLDLKLAWPRVSVQAAYAPVFSLTDDVDVAKPLFTVLHAGHAGVGYGSTRLTLALDQSFAYGQQSYVDLVSYTRADVLGTPATASPGTLGANGAARFDLIPGAQAVSVAAERTQALGSYFFTPRWNAELRASYGFTGGRNAMARALLLRQDTLEAAAALTFSRTTHSRVSMGAQGYQIWTSLKNRYRLAALTTNWTQELGARSALSLTANLIYQVSHSLSAGEYTDVGAWIPGAAASLKHRIIVSRATYFSIVARADFAPSVNAIVGTLQKRVNGAVVLDLEYRRFVASVGGTVGQTFPLAAPDATSIIAGNATLRLGLNDRVSALTSVQLAKQLLATSSALAPVLWIAYVGLAASAAPVAF